MPKRPNDPNALAKLIVGIASGEVSNPPIGDDARKRVGVNGGKARSKALTPSQRSAIARKAAAARWAKPHGEKP